MSTATCFTLAVIHFFVWVYAYEKWSSLFFSICATAAAAISVLDLEMMHARTPAEFGELLRWMHVSIATIIIALVWFIHHYLQTGRLWLAWLICGLRALALVPNFVMYPNASFREIYGLTDVAFLSETVSVPVGEQNPWYFLIRTASTLLLIYVLDAAISAWKQGKRMRALVLGGATTITIIMGVTSSSLMIRGILPSPLIGIIFVLIVLVMAVELSLDLIRAGQLSRDLFESRERVDLAVRAANLALWEWDIGRNEIWATEVGRASAGTIGPEHICFDHYLQLVQSDDREIVQQAVRRVLEGDRVFEAEYRMTDPDGATRWIAAYGRMERGVHDKPLRVRGVSMDITERKRAEDEFRKQRNELAHVQRVSTLGQFSAALAHEINQPLGAILRNAEAGELLLRQSPADLKELRDVFVDIQQDERRAAAVIERMRSLLRRSEPRFDARFDGLLQSLNFKAGDIVKKGQLLFRFLTLEQDYLLKIDQANMQREAAGLELAKAELGRTQTLHKKDVASEAALSVAVAKRDVATAKYAAAKGASRDERDHHQRIFALCAVRRDYQ
jgi:two-component system, LuxR family, sensor kinase FixL